MSLSKRETLSGWGHCPVTECKSFRPEKQRDLQQLIARHDSPLIARGLGRSYGDASLQPHGTVRTERLDHLIHFDRINGIVQAQGGVTLAELMALSIPKGWLPPIIPGTRFVTLAGAFACNVHGKNHFREGDFAEHVLSIRLLMANGDSIDCSPNNNSEIFWATAGGMGMTGIIEEVTLKLKPIESISLKTLSYRVDSLEDMIAAFEHYRDQSDYLVGWIDHMDKEEPGRGVFEAAQHISPADGGKTLDQFEAPGMRIRIPFFMPPFLLNAYTMKLYNARHFRKYSHERTTKIVSFNGFFHPLDGIGNWNRLYGKRGFYQYQCVLPETPDVARHLHDLLDFIHGNKLSSFLAVLKYHRESKGIMTFPMRGYSLALDFPNTAHVRALLPQLDRWVAGRGGRIYLAKDALLAPEIFYQMYPHAHDWCELIRDIDPNARFQSMMSERLQWKGQSLKDGAHGG